LVVVVGLPTLSKNRHHLSLNPIYRSTIIAWKSMAGQNMRRKRHHNTTLVVGEIGTWNSSEGMWVLFTSWYLVLNPLLIVLTFVAHGQICIKREREKKFK
jgi:hypothetical protein